MATATDLSTRVGPYEVIETAYAGAFNVVFRCRDDELPRELAVKGVRADGADPRLARRQLLREARLRALVSHPHVLPLFRSLEGAGGEPLLVGPWLPGGSLRDLGQRPLPVAQVLTLAEGLGGALDTLHAADWWHGDVSPGNVLFHAGEPVLTDFGAARRIGARATRSGTLVVTPHVSAPEVWAGSPVDGRADVYSLGAVLYQALTGAWPFDASEPAAFAELHQWAVVPLPSAKAPLVGTSVGAVLLRALAKKPEQRYSTASRLAAELRSAMQADGLLADDPPPEESGADRAAPPGTPAVAAAGERLERFAATLDERELAALRVVMRRSAAVEARAWNETEQIAMQLFAPAAALLALEDCGATAALAEGHDTPAEVAAACAAPERPIARLLELLASIGLVARVGDGYRLPPGPAALYAGRASNGGSARPLREAAAFWAHLSSWTATGEPFTHMDRPDGAVYARTAARAGLVAAGAARELAEALLAGGFVPERGAVLDVGAGSGVWGLAVAAVAPGIRVTALDRPLVLDETRLKAEAAGLGARFEALPGDWRDVRLPAGAFDLAVLANVCHLEPPGEVTRLLERIHGALRTGGAAVVVDTIPEPGANDVGALLQGLHLALRTACGDVHDRASYTAWLADAGFGAAEVIPLRSTAGSLSALVACRR